MKYRSACALTSRFHLLQGLMAFVIEVDELCAVVESYTGRVVYSSGRCSIKYPAKNSLIEFSKGQVSVCFDRRLLFK